MLLAAEALEASPLDVEFESGRYTVKGTDKRISLQEIVARHAGGVTHPLDTIAEVPAGRAFPSGAHVAEVEIDIETGAAHVVAYTAVDDVGRAVNPGIIHGQVHGGIVQGVGQALLERCHYDPQTGQLLSGSFMDYAMPRAADGPSFVFETNNVPCTTNPLGVKGAGEAGAIGAPPSVVNAIVNAIFENTGVKHVDMPVTAASLWKVIEAHRGRKAA